MKKLQKQSKKVYWIYAAGLALGVIIVQASGPFPLKRDVSHVQGLSVEIESQTDTAASPKTVPAAPVKPELPKPEAAPTPKTASAPAPKSAATPKPAKPAAESLAATPVAPQTPKSTGDIASEAQCPGQSGTAAMAQALTCMSAYARTQNGLTTITANSALMASAAAKAQDMATCGYSHTACDRPLDYWILPKGYTGRCSGENIALGQKSSGQVFVDWMNSPGHRKNILNPDFRHIGVAVISMNGREGWVMQLGGC